MTQTNESLPQQPHHFSLTSLTLPSVTYFLTKDVGGRKCVIFYCYKAFGAMVNFGPSTDLYLFTGQINVNVERRQSRVNTKGKLNKRIIGRVRAVTALDRLWQF